MSVERLVLKHIQSVIPNSLDPYQFAYRSNRSVEDAISIALHTVLEHVDLLNVYCRMLFIDFSSAFNTIVPSKLLVKLRELGLPPSICEWILDFLVGREQVVRIGNFTSSSIITNVGAPQGCVLSSFLYLLYTYDFVAKSETNLFIKFADDTCVIGKIKNNDESAYRQEVVDLTKWCSINNLELNVSKTKEVIVDFRLNREAPTPIIINGAEVEIVDNFKYLGVHISKDLKWHLNCTSIVKKAQQRLYFLRCLKKAGVSTKTQTNFYRSTVESLLTANIATWYGSCSDEDRTLINRVVRTAKRIIGVDLPSVADIYRQRCCDRALKIFRDPSHPGKGLITLLPSGRRYRWERCPDKKSKHKVRTSRLVNSFYPEAVRFLNKKR